jgi:hypothetical protein
VEGFGTLLSETMNMTLRKVFGETASDVIYQLMERQVSLTREETGEKIDAFHAYLTRLVGSEVSQIILTTSLKTLCRELQREYAEVEKCFSVLDELYEVKFRLLAPSLKEERSACN